jgi:cell division septation protein DedD
LKIKSLFCIVLFFLLASLFASGLQKTTSLGQTVGGSTMISGVLAHEMTAAEAQLLANSNINWVSCDVTFNPSDISEWSQVYLLAQQYHLSLMGILDQHLMNYSNTFTLNDWSNAVTQAVDDFGSVVKTWEIWNEPDYPNNTLGYFDGSAQTYVAMLQTAYNDIKAVAPSDTVIGLGGMPLYDAENQTINFYTQQAYAWATQVVQLGGMNYCDAIAVHAYPYGQYIPELAGSSYTDYVQQYQQLCNKPIWVTEVGQESYSTTWAATETQQSAFLTQSYSLFQSLDVKAYFWYELNDNYTAIPDSNFGLFDNNGNQKPALDAFIDAVNGLTPTTGVPTPTSTAPPTQNPTTNPTSSPSQSPSQSLSPTAAATSKPAPTPTTIPVFEENYAAVLVFAVVMVSGAAILVIMKKLQNQRECGH